MCTELVYRAYDEIAEGEGVRFPLVRVIGRDTMPADEVVRMFARERSMDGEPAAQGLPPSRQFDFVIFPKEYSWTGGAHPVGVEEFVRTVERPVNPITHDETPGQPH